jgi:hypothetical protein
MTGLIPKVKNLGAALQAVLWALPMKPVPIIATFNFFKALSPFYDGIR